MVVLVAMYERFTFITTTLWECDSLLLVMSCILFVGYMVVEVVAAAAM